MAAKNLAGADANVGRLLNQVAKEAANQAVERLRNPGPEDSGGTPELSSEAIDRLHDIFEETGDKSIGRLLDQVCDREECESTDDQEDGD